MKIKSKGVGHDGNKVGAPLGGIKNFAALIILALLGVAYISINLLDVSSGVVLGVRFVAVILISVLLASDKCVIRFRPFVLLMLFASILSSPVSAISLNILFIMLFVQASKAVGIESLINSSTFVLGALVTITLLLLWFGVTESVTDLTGVLIGNNEELRTRMTFGFKNVNGFTSVVSGFCLLLMLPSDKKWIRYIASLVLTLVVFKYTDSRSLLVSTLFFILISESAIFFNHLNLNRVSYIFCCVLILVPVMVSLSPGMLISQYPVLDVILSGRLSYLDAYYNTISPVSLIVGGSEPANQMTVDNSFGLIVGAIGVPLFLCLTMVCLKMIKKLIDLAEFSKLAFLVSFWAYSFSESSMVRPESIICLVFWFLITQKDAMLQNNKLSA